jgi:addiction module HigA family antidote
MPKSPAQTPDLVLLALMDQYNLNPTTLAKHIGLSQPTVRSLTLGNVKINVSIALRLAKYFGTTPAYWLDLQTKIDFNEAKKDKKLIALIKTISKVKKQPKQHAELSTKAKTMVKEPIVKAPVLAEPRIPKKRGRKPKLRPAVEPVQEYKFTPRIILIKKKDIAASAFQSSPDISDERN